MRLIIVLAMVAALPFFGAISALGVTIESKVKLARDYKPSGPVLKCGPEASGDILSVNQLIPQIKMGCTIILTPGHYKIPLQITEGKVLITGDGSGKKCDIDIRVLGRDCVVRNVWIDDLRADRDIIVVDSIIGDLATAYNRERNYSKNQYIYNSCLEAVNMLYYTSKDMKVFLKKCVVVGISGPAVSCGENVRLAISDSVIVSRDIPFRFSSSYMYGKRKGKLTLDNCAIYGVNGLGKIDHEIGKQAFTLKELKRLANVAFKNTAQAKPLFQNNFLDSKDRLYCTTPKMFIQTEDSPAKEKGPDPETHPILSKHLNDPEPPKRPAAPPKKPVPAPRPTPPKPPSPPKKTPPKTKPENPKENGEDDSDFGGIPKAPE